MESINTYRYLLITVPQVSILAITISYKWYEISEKDWNNKKIWFFLWSQDDSSKTRNLKRQKFYDYRKTEKLRPLGLEIPEEKVYEVKREIRNILPKKWDKGLASIKEMYDEIINALKYSS